MLEYSMRFRRSCKALSVTYSRKITLVSFIFITLISLLSSCRSAKEVTYFTDLSDSLLVHLPEMKRYDATIMTDDLLDIRIAGASEQTTALFNSYGSSTEKGINIQPHLVDFNGEIEFPLIGKVKAAGLTREQLKNEIKTLVNKYLKEPIVTVRFVNFRFTVLGEVRSPGTFVNLNEKVTILEALGQAGDMTQYAKRNTVRVIRDSSGKREIGMINFNQKTVFTSPYFYLQRNDVIYVEPRDSKTNYETITRVTSILATALGIVAVIFSIVK